MAMMYFMEFTAVDGTTILQKAEAIDTVFESTVPAKGSTPAKKIIHLLLRNNNRIQVVGETRESIQRRLMAQGQVVMIEGDPVSHDEPQEALEAVVAEGA